MSFKCQSRLHVRAKREREREIRGLFFIRCVTNTICGLDKTEMGASGYYIAVTVLLRDVKVYKCKGEYII